MSWRILILAAGLVLASSAAFVVFAGSNDAPSDDPPAVAEEPADGINVEEVSALPEDGDANGDPDGALGVGAPDANQREVLGIPEENTNPCDNVQNTDGDDSGCRQVENAGGVTLNLPDPAADGIAAALEHRAQAMANAEDAASNGDGANGSHGPPPDVPHGPPDGVPRGGPNAAP